MSLKLCQITDCHLTADGLPLNGTDTTQSLQRVIARIAKQHGDINALLATGDIGHTGTKAEYETFRELTAVLDKPVWCLPGNHDCPDIMQAELSKPPWQCPPGLIAGGWQILFLDSVVTGQSGGHLPDSELARCRTALGANRLPTLICLHHHPVHIGSVWMDGMMIDNGDRLLDLLAGYPQVRGLLWGHIHQTFEQRDGNRLDMGSPSTCFQFRPRAESFAMDDQGPGWRWLELRDDGEIVTEICWCDTPQRSI